MGAATGVVEAAASTAAAVASMAAVRSAAARAFVAAPDLTVVSGVDQADSAVDRLDFAEARTVAFVADASEAPADVSDRRAVSLAPETPVGVTVPAEAGAAPHQQLVRR